MINKFRAWDNWTKKMYYSGDNVLEVNFGTEGQLLVSVGNHLCDIMQSTGLLDVNKKEIYFGDILKIFNKNYEVKLEQTDSRVEIDYGYGNKHNGPAPYWVEVIGNKFENANLLK